MGSNPSQDCSEIDETKAGEPWIQGLAEGEYSDLCVEERLSALVALIGIANEGNSIRAILEVINLVNLSILTIIPLLSLSAI